MRGMNSKYLEEFDKEFKATGAEVVGFKRHEYSNLREHQFNKAREFLDQALTAVREEERGRILKGLENAPAESITMGWDAYEGDFVRDLVALSAPTNLN